MMIAVYVGKNPPGSSMYLVGKQIVDNAGGVLVSKIDATMKGAEKVICLVPEDFPKLEKARRFLGIGEIVLFLAANWEEFSLWERGAMLAQATECKFVVHSWYSDIEVTKTAKALLSPAKYRAFDKNLFMIPYGVSDEFSPTPKDVTKWIVPFNRVNQTQKNVALHKELTSKFKIIQKGKTDHMFIVFGGAGFEKDVDLSDYSVVAQPETREEYVQLIADRGAFLCTSNYESFGIYYLELLCSGCIGVFMDKSWINELLPGYQLIAKDKAQAIAMMKDVVARPEYWYDYVATTTIPFIRGRYDLKRFATRIMEV